MDNKEEIWKDIVGYEGAYQASSMGNIRSLDRFIYNKGSSRSCLCKGRELKQSNVRGYRQIGLAKDGVKLIIMTHRVVAMTFIPNPENKPQVNHINGVKSDNRVENLEWCTISENYRHAIRTGLLSCEELAKGQKKSVLSRSRRIIDTDTMVIYNSITEAAEATGIYRTYLSWMLRGKGKNNTKMKFYKEAD